MRVHPALLVGAALIVLSFNETLIYAIGELSALQDRALRPALGVLALAVPGLALLAYGASASSTRSGREASALENG